MGTKYLADVDTREMTAPRIDTGRPLFSGGDMGGSAVNTTRELRVGQ